MGPSGVRMSVMQLFCFSFVFFWEKQRTQEAASEKVLICLQRLRLAQG